MNEAQRSLLTLRSSINKTLLKQVEKIHLRLIHHRFNISLEIEEYVKKLDKIS